MGKRTEVTIETREVWVIHQPCPPATNHPSARAHCQLCAAWVEWLTPDEAVTVTGLSQRQLFRLIENAQVHFRETAAGGILTPYILAWVVCSIIGGRLILRIGYRPVVLTGMLLMMLGGLMLAFVSPATARGYLAGAVMLMGMGSHFEIWDAPTLKRKENEAIQAGDPDALDLLQGGDERAKGEVTIKDLIEGAKAAGAIKGHDEWREARPAQVSVPEAKLVDTVRDIIARHVKPS